MNGEAHSSFDQEYDTKIFRKVIFNLLLNGMEIKMSLRDVVQHIKGCSFSFNISQWVSQCVVDYLCH